MRSTSTRLTRFVSSTLAAIALSACTVASADAAQHVWVGVPGTGGATGSALIDRYSNGYWSSSASGLVYVSTRGCATMQYAPYANLAADGGWNNTPAVCNGAAYRSWSDTFRLAYNGFKFRLCKNGTCGSAVNIRF